MYHYCAYIRDNNDKHCKTSFAWWFRHMETPSDSRTGETDGWNTCYTWINVVYCLSRQIRPYHMTWTKYWNSDFKFWIYMKKWVLVIYYMLFLNVSPTIPFWEIITVMAPTQAIWQISRCLLQIYHLPNILHCPNQITWPIRPYLGYKMLYPC
jgi:hypothetical protein